MPNLKDIRRRIKSVKNTQKITQAMRMVAAAKVKRAETKMKAARPYASKLAEVFRQVFELVQPQLQDVLANPDAPKVLSLLKPREVKSVGILVLSSDRGLCGAYNSSILRRMFQLEKAYAAEGLTPKFYLVGNKAIQAYKRYGTHPVLGRLAGITAAPSSHDAQTMVNTLVEAYQTGEIDKIIVLSTRFRSLISYKVTELPLIPVEQEDATASNTTTASTTGEIVFEPTPVTVLETLIPMYLTQTIYMALMEAAASELAARMTAMSNASTNAKEMIGKLTLSYNKARQAAITQEILEVVSGANAL